MAAMNPRRSDSVLAAAERALLVSALGSSRPGRVETAIEEVELQIACEDMLLVLIEGLSHTALAAAETLVHLSSPDLTAMLVPEPEADR